MAKDQLHQFQVLNPSVCTLFTKVNGPLHIETRLFCRKETLHQNWDSWVSLSRPCRIQVQYLEVTFPLMSIRSSLSVALPARLLAGRGKGLNVER